MVELTRQFPPEQLWRGLESWTWLPDLSGLRPWFTSAFGDVFLTDASDAVWFLDTIEGRLSRRWDDVAGYEAAVSTTEGLDDVLLAGLVEAAARAGVTPGPTEVLDFVVAPVLGGTFEVANIQTMDFVVSLNLAGQLHEQMRSRP